MLGAQPPAPGTASFRYVDYEYSDVGMELARSQPYYTEESYPPAIKPLIDISQEPIDEIFCRDERDLNSLMLLGPQPTRHRGYPRPYPTTMSFPAQQPMQ